MHVHMWAHAHTHTNPCVGELIASKYVTESINNWLQDISATRAFVSCIQYVLYSADEGSCGWNVLQSVVDWFCYVFAHNQFAYIEERSNEPLWHYQPLYLPQPEPAIKGWSSRRQQDCDHGPFPQSHGPLSAVGVLICRIARPTKWEVGVVLSEGWGT